jgi:membrane fusion protein (multidrug efflux system)
LALALAVVLLAAWAAWFFRAQVAVYAMSIDARLEVAHEVHPVEAGVAGTVKATYIALGQEVDEGDVLVELDPRTTKLQLEEQRARLSTIASQIEVLERELDAERQVLAAERGVSTAALAEARAREREAKAMAVFANEKARRWEELASGGVVSGVDHLEAKATATQRDREIEALHLGVRRLQQEGHTRLAELRALIDRLEREDARLRGEQVTAEAMIERLEHELDRHLIRSPVKGSIGEVSALRVGAVVSAGDRLGAVVPAGDIRAVARFTPAEASGRLKRGQRARLRLEGFPWTQYGSISARVSSVASEPQGGGVRVELDIDSSSSTSIPLEHGLPGSAEVEVERASPAVLVLRAAGHLITSTGRPTANSEPRGQPSTVQEATR